MKRPALLASLLATGLLAACGKSEAPAAGSQTAAPPAASTDAATAPDRRDAKPMDAYELIDLSPSTYPEPAYLGLIHQVRAAFWSVTPRNMDQLAFDYLDAYRAEADSFKRADIVKANTAQLEQDYSAAQQRHDYSVRTSSLMQVYPYDTATGGFKVLFSTDDERSAIGVFKNAGNQHPYGAWSFRLVGIPRETSGNELIYKPTSEDEARAIEAALASQRSAGDGSVNVYAQYEGHTLGSIRAATKDDIILFGIDAITAVDRKTGKPLLTIGGKDLGPIKVECSSTRQALKLAEPAAPTAVWAEAASSQPSC